MKKFYFECSICPILKDNIVRYVTNTKKIFTPDFVKQNYHKHFGYSLVLTFFSIGQIGHSMLNFFIIVLFFMLK